MSRIVVLDTGPLSLLASPVKSPAVRNANSWAADLLGAGFRLLVPAVADFEVRRELERLQRAQSLARLDAFNIAVADRYLPISDEVLRLGARLWAEARNRGTPTADPRELDCDVLIAAHALTLGVLPSDLVIATTNVGHLSQFVDARLWTDIRP
jgi:predicted nucleic acid-binding protein